MPYVHAHALIETIGAAVVFGLAAGFSPGPLLALTISQSVRFGAREGVKVALAPFFTDAPIIAASLAALAWMQHFKPALGIVTLAGALFVCRLAYESFRAPPVRTLGNTAKAGSLGKGIIANFLSPHPYIYWMTVGSPFVIRTWAASHAAAVLFPVCFLSSLAAAKVLVAFAAGHSGKYVSDKVYSAVMKTLGAALLIFAVLLAWEGVTLAVSR
jgi:threonine/homoserine/homoserine lactone efflux protein